MKNLLRVFLTVTMMLCFTVSNAQQPTTPTTPPPTQGGEGTRPPRQMTQQTPEAVAQEQVDWMTTELSLDDATKSKVSEIVLRNTKTRLEERSKIREAGGDMNAMTAKNNELYSKMDAEIKTVLNAATYEKYIKLATEKRSSAMNRGQRPGGNFPGPQQGGEPARPPQGTAN